MWRREEKKCIYLKKNGPLLQVLKDICMVVLWSICRKNDFLGLNQSVEIFDNEQTLSLRYNFSLRYIFLDTNIRSVQDLYDKNRKILIQSVNK